jgi:hypothetical protein
MSARQRLARGARDARKAASRMALHASKRLAGSPRHKPAKKARAKAGARGKRR